jgi:hypothetical protein
MTAEHDDADNHKGKPPPVYRVQIDKTIYDFDHPVVTGVELLTKAGKTPVQDFALYRKLKGLPPERVADLQAPIDLADQGVERFVTLPLDQTEGLGRRREFALPEEDQDWLDACGLEYDLVNEGGVLRVVLHAFPIHPGYDHSHVEANVRIEPGYPDSQIDMVYFHPPLARVDGRPIGALCNDAFDGKVWQRWSRHRTGANPWRPGVDNLSTHFALVESWLAREFKKA